MTFLYLCRTDGDEYRISKMDDLGNIESSYLCSEEECTCPAGVRPTCRHRAMLPKFLRREAVNTGWAYDYDRGGWVGTEWGPQEPAIAETEPPEGQVFLTSSTAEPAVIHYQGVDIRQVDELPPLPEGVTMIVMDNPGKVVVHNAITEAVGEPPAPTHIKRRF